MSPPMSVCLSVCLSVCPSRFRVRTISFDETMCSAYVWPRSVQGQGHNLRLNIVWMYFVSALYLWTPGGFYKLFCTNVSYDGTMCNCAVPMFDQGRFKVNVTVYDLTLYDCISLYIFWTPGRINKILCSNVSYAETMCRAYVWPMLHRTRTRTHIFMSNQ